MDNLNNQIGTQHHRKLNLTMLLTIPLLLAGLVAAVFLSQQGQETRSKASEKDVQLKLTSNDTKLKAGEIAKINVLIDTKDQKVSGIELHINFPEDTFEGVRFAPGTFLKKAIVPGTFASGSASMVLISECAADNCKPKKGSGVVASLQLKVKDEVESGKADVKINKKSAVAVVGQKSDALGRTTDLALHITGKTGTTPTPSVTPPAANPDYLIFTKPLFDFVLPDAVPATGEMTSTIKLSATPDEYEPATFVVRATQKDLAGVTVTATDLEKGTRTIPKQNIDIRVVKVWKQGGLDKTIDFPAGILVPELLLYNDAEKLTGGLRPDGSYVPPTISTTLRTNIPKDTSKQFWVTVYIPPGTPAGKYTGFLTISAGNTASQQITLEATVLPISLKQPKQIYGLYYRLVDPLNNTAILQQELTDIRTHGFQAMVYPRYDDIQSFRQVLSLAKTLGFIGPIIGGGAKFASSAGLLREFGYEPYLYGIDEPQIDDLETGKGIRYHIRRSYNIHKAGGKVMTAIVKSTSDALDNPVSSVYDQIDPATGKRFRDKGITNEKLDMVNYQAHGLTYSSRGSGKPLWDYIEGLRKGTTPKLAKQEVYYWQIWVEKPLLNRMMAGFFLWTSKLDGIYPYVYQALVEESRDPFDDFDNAPDRKNRDTMTTYPSARGPIPTTKWEALREGYDDVRYLTTFYDLLPALRAKNSQLATSLAQEVKTELARYNDPKDYAKLSGADFGKTRQMVIRSILAAQDELGPTPTPTHYVDGDLDRDGDVDIFDYNLLVADFGKTGVSGFVPADINKNGEVDIFDYNILVENYTDTG